MALRELLRATQRYTMNDLAEPTDGFLIAWLSDADAGRRSGRTRWSLARAMARMVTAYLVGKQTERPAARVESTGCRFKLADDLLRRPPAMAWPIPR
jgi:hypothetical protein